MQRWLTAAEDDSAPPSPVPKQGFCGPPLPGERSSGLPGQEDPQPYQDLTGGFSKHLQGALSPPLIVARTTMTAWEAPIVGAQWAQEWSP